MQREKKILPKTEAGSKKYHYLYKIVNKLIRFKSEVDSKLRITPESKAITSLRLWFKKLLLGELESICHTLTNEHNDWRFHSISLKALRLLNNLGFIDSTNTSVIKSRPLIAA